MSNFTHHPHVDVEINPWVAASGFCAFDEVEQAKFFQHIAEMTEQWKVNRVFQWESLIGELWKISDSDNKPVEHYDAARKLLGELIEYFSTKVSDPGNFWRDETRRMEQINCSVREQNGKLAGSNTILKGRVRALENELAAKRSETTVEGSVRDADGELAPGIATVPAAFHFERVGALEKELEAARKVMNAYGTKTKELETQLIKALETNG